MFRMCDQKRVEIIDQNGLLSLLSKRRSIDPPHYIVRGFVHIDGEKAEVNGQKIPFEGFTLENFTFTDMVFIEHHRSIDKEGRPFSLRIGRINFLEGLQLSSNNGGWLILRHCYMRDLTIYRSQFETVQLLDLKVSKQVDIGGLSLSKVLEINNVQFEELRLRNHVSEMVQTPLVKTADPLIAEQFRLANIPVVMPTGQVRQALKRPEEAIA